MSKSIGKTDLVRELARKTGQTHDVTALVLDAFTATVQSLTAEGTRVDIRGFGRFEMKHRSARMGRNPATGAAVEIPASATLGFKAAKPKS